ncbi:MAG: carbon-nitrogen hydrolase family protein [Dehalococcoidia bacterium]|jgi:predicted amidohydrolase|nr:carbon-nitrogen hydrolase family protein [Dehalococcoidia bacterium]
MKEKRILGGRKEVRVATAQAAPVFMDKEKTIEKVSGLMAEAAKGGAQLVVFPETFIPTYPAWYTGGWESQPREWAPYMVALQDNAVVVGSRDTEALGEAARAANIYAAIGINELDDRTGSRTVYNTLIFMGPDGKVLGRHRKLMPTYTERTYWGWGDASDLFVLDTDIGRIGGLICGENMMILLKAAMMHRGEEFHIAVWPGAWSAHGKTSLMDPETDTLGGTCPIYPVIRSYALESQCFVLSCGGILRREDIPENWDYLHQGQHLNYAAAVGGSAIVNPMGRYMAGPSLGEETILYADCHANQLKLAKVIFDCLGHYTRWDAVQLKVRTEPWTPDGSEGRTHLPEVPREDLKRISQEWEIDVDQLEGILQDLSRSPAGGKITT